MSKRVLFILLVSTTALIIGWLFRVMLKTHQAPVVLSQEAQTKLTVVQQTPQQPLQQYQPPQQVVFCPACHGAGYFLKLPRDLCPKCRGHGVYQVVYIKRREYYFHGSSSGLGLNSYDVYGFSEEEVGRETKVCEVCGVLGVIFNPSERCETCGGVVTEEWKEKWKELARQYALNYPIYVERVVR